MQWETFFHKMAFLTVVIIVFNVFLLQKYGVGAGYMELGQITPPYPGHNKTASVPSSQNASLNASSEENFTEPHEVCFDNLGCFTMTHPFYSKTRKIQPPQSPEKIGTTFRLHTRHNPHPDQVEFLDSSDEFTIMKSYFKVRQKTIIIIHGFTSTGTTEWVRVLKEEFLIKENINVIIVDWGDGAQFTYSQAASNTRVVAAQTVELLKVLMDKMKLQTKKIHIIGHSLGAHIAGYVGKRIPNIGRITALEPASILFYDNIPQLRLHRSDALFVDVIHTNSGTLGFGLQDQIGDADFYVNNAEFQPGCIADTGEEFGNCMQHSLQEVTKTEPIEPATCSHHRSITYFTESINKPCLFWSFNCSSFNALKSGECWECEYGKTCNRMGYYAIKDPEGKNRTFRVITLSQAPFCANAYKLNLVTGSLQFRPARGEVTINVAVKDIAADTRHLTFDIGNSIHVHRKSVTSKIAFLRELATDMTSAEVTYTKHAPLLTSWIYSKRLDVKKIELETIDQNGKIRRETFCGETVIRTGETAIFQPDDCFVNEIKKYFRNSLSELLHLGYALTTEASAYIKML